MTITIDEAIKSNTALAKELDIPQRATEREGIQLGIEALQRIKAIRPYRNTDKSYYLPGETKD